MALSWNREHRHVLASGSGDNTVKVCFMSYAVRKFVTALFLVTLLGNSSSWGSVFCVCATPRHRHSRASETSISRLFLTSVPEWRTLRLVAPFFFSPNALPICLLPTPEGLGRDDAAVLGYADAPLGQGAGGVLASRGGYGNGHRRVSFWRHCMLTTAVAAAPALLTLEGAHRTNTNIQTRKEKSSPRRSISTKFPPAGSLSRGVFRNRTKYFRGHVWPTIVFLK